MTWGRCWVLGSLHPDAPWLLLQEPVRARTIRRGWVTQSDPRAAKAYESNFWFLPTNPVVTIFMQYILVRFCPSAKYLVVKYFPSLAPPVPRVWSARNLDFLISWSRPGVPGLAPSVAESPGLNMHITLARVNRSHNQPLVSSVCHSLSITPTPAPA